MEEMLRMFGCDYSEDDVDMASPPPPPSVTLSQNNNHVTAPGHQVTTQSVTVSHSSSLLNGGGSVTTVGHPGDRIINNLKQEYNRCDHCNNLRDNF